MEVCPSCGAFVDALNSSGWCNECNPVCARCGGVLTSTHKLCIACQREAWLIRNADAIERYMREGQTYTQAKQQVSDDNRAVCVMCGQPVIGKNRNQTLFCTRTEECRRARFRYNYRVQRGMRQDEALEQILER